MFLPFALVVTSNSLISLVITLVVVGLILWLVETMLPLDPVVKRVIHVVIIICVILWLVRMFL